MKAFRLLRTYNTPLHTAQANTTFLHGCPLHQMPSPCGGFRGLIRSADRGLKALRQERKVNPAPSDCKVLLQHMRLLDITGRWLLFFVPPYTLLTR